VRGEFVEHRPQLRFTVEQRRIVQPLAHLVEADGVFTGHPRCHPSSQTWLPDEHRRSAAAPATRPTLRVAVSVSWVRLGD